MLKLGSKYSRPSDSERVFRLLSLASRTPGLAAIAAAVGRIGRIGRKLVPWVWVCQPEASRCSKSENHA